jgi:DNA polymerase III alpha subunit
VPIPVFFHSDSSLSHGNDTPSYFLKEAKSKGYSQTCLVDVNTTSSAIKYMDASASQGIDGVVGLTASVCCPQRDRELWKKINYKKCKKLFAIIGTADDKFFDYDTVIGLFNALKAAINSKVKIAAAQTKVESLIGPLAHEVFKDGNLQNMKKMLKHINKELPLGSLSFVAQNEDGYKSILYLNSALGKRKSDNINNGEDEPIALTIQDIEKYAKNVFVIDGFQKGSYLEPFKDEPEKLSSFPYFAVIDALGVPYNKIKDIEGVAANLDKSFVPFPLFSLSREEDYQAYCVKVAVHTKAVINSLAFDKPDMSRILADHETVFDFYQKECANFLNENYNPNFWDSLNATSVTLGEIHLPNFDMPIQEIVRYAFKKENKEVPEFGDDAGAIEAFDALIKPTLPSDKSLVKYRNRRLNDFCLHSIACEGMEKRLTDNFGDEKEQKREEYTARLEKEFEVIESMGFAGYFLIEYEAVNFARENDIPVAPGRGSAAGSFIVYCIEVTDVDPIEFDLQFERFLNPERVSMPDIDTDFGEGRSKVLKFISDKYQQPGAEWPSSSQIANIMRYQLKSSISAVRGAFGLSMAFDAELKRLVEDAENELGIVEPKKISWDELMGLDFVKRKMSREPMLAKVLFMAKSLTGKTQSYGVHAGGVVISPTVICDFSALWCDDKGNYFCLYDKDCVERAGLVKFDFLGLKTLNVTQESVLQIKENHGIDVNLRKINFKDPAVYDLISEQVLCDIFQLGSKGIRQLVGNLKPSNMEELAVLSALFRPGALQSEMDKDYIAVKNGVRPATYDHPALESVTGVTFGCIVYQEQVMSIVRSLANYSLGEADILRRAMGKKKIAEMNKQRNIYSKRAMEYWRDHYLKIGEKQGFDFPLDVCFKDCESELDSLKIKEFFDGDGYLSESEGFRQIMKTILSLNENEMTMLDGRVSDYSYVVKLFKGHYQSGIESSVIDTLVGNERCKEISVRLYYVLSQYVRFNQVFNKVEKFAGYGFNKSHAVAYSMVTYMTAWLKKYYPAEFYAGSMTFMKRDVIHESVIEASQKMGIKITAPDINLSRERFRAESVRSVRYGFSKLDGMGNAAGTIVKERELNGPFIGVYDFLRRMENNTGKPSSEAFVSLAVSGGFDKFIPTRIQRDPRTNGRQYNVWLRECISKSKSLKVGEGTSSLHNLVDEMSKQEFAAYLTVLSGITYSKKISFTPTKEFGAEIYSAFREVMKEVGYISLSTLSGRGSELYRSLKGVAKVNFLKDVMDKPEETFRFGLRKLGEFEEAEVMDILHDWDFELGDDSLDYSPENIRKICPGIDEDKINRYETLYFDSFFRSFGDKFSDLIFAAFVGKMNVTYGKIELDDHAITPVKERLLEVGSHHPGVRVAKDFFDVDKTPFERHFLFVLDVILNNPLFSYETQWENHLAEVLNQSVADTLNKERAACGFYLTSTPIKVLKIAERVEREPPGHLIDGCPVKVGMIDGSHDGQKVTTYGVVRNIFLTAVKNEMSDNYGEKMMFFDLEDGADKLSCVVIGNKAVKVLHQKVIDDGVVCMLCGKVTMNDRGISMKPVVIKRYHPVEDAHLHKVPKG